MSQRSPSLSRLPTLRQLRYLVALDEHGHFGRAAASCHVSQSAFSIGIRELESTLGVRLVDRTAKRISFSTLGRDVVTQARLCLRDAESLVEMARARSDPLVGPLYLGVIPTVAPFVLPRLMPAIKHRYPRLEVYLLEEQTDELLAQLAEGKLDLVLMALPYDVPHAEVLCLYRDPFRLACAEGTARVDPHDYRFNRLQQDSVLLLGDGHCLRDHALTACRIRRREKVSRVAATSLLTLVQMVDADLGITFLPAMAEGSAMLASTRVRTYPLREEAYREIALVWRRGSARGEEFRALGELVREVRVGGEARVAAPGGRRRATRGAR